MFIIFGRKDYYLKIIFQSDANEKLYTITTINKLKNKKQTCNKNDPLNHVLIKNRLP